MMTSKYARPERERRWLVRRPPDQRRLAEPRRIEDRYLEGSTLRLRKVTRLHGGGEAEFKLGQKVRPDPHDPAGVMHTSIYLTEQEHARLAVLAAAELIKVRHTITVGGDRFALDVFEGRHRGLAMLEVELQEGSDPGPPDFAGPEVTGQEPFSGGWLAFAPDDSLKGLLRALGIAAGG